MKPGEPSQLGATGSATVSVGQVIVGRHIWLGQTITVTHSAADTPSSRPRRSACFPGQPWIELSPVFLPHLRQPSDRGRCFRFGWSAKAHGDFVSVADVVTRLRRYASRGSSGRRTCRRRSRWLRAASDRVCRPQHRARSRCLPLPPHHFDAVWAFRLGPDGKRVGDDWAGVGHWEHIKTAEALPNLAAGAQLRRSYVIPFSALGIKERGTYRLGVHLESSPLRKGERAVKGIDPSRVWLGDSTSSSLM